MARRSAPDRVGIKISPEMAFKRYEDISSEDTKPWLEDLDYSTTTVGGREEIQSGGLWWCSWAVYM